MYSTFELEKKLTDLFISHLPYFICDEELALPNENNLMSLSDIKNDGRKERFVACFTNIEPIQNLNAGYTMAQYTFQFCYDTKLLDDDLKYKAKMYSYFDVFKACANKINTQRLWLNQGFNVRLFLPDLFPRDSKNNDRFFRTGIDIQFIY